MYIYFNININLFNIVMTRPLDESISQAVALYWSAVAWLVSRDRQVGPAGGGGAPRDVTAGPRVWCTCADALKVTLGAQNKCSEVRAPFLSLPHVRRPVFAVRGYQLLWPVLYMSASCGRRRCSSITFYHNPRDWQDESICVKLETLWVQTNICGNFTKNFQRDI